MAVDEDCDPYVLAIVMATPTARRLAHLAGLTETDLATDLSGLVALVLRVAQQRGVPAVPRQSVRHEPRELYG